MMYNLGGIPTLVVGILFIATLVNSQEELTCDTAKGWTYLGRGKCYKLFHQNDVRAWDRARDICKSYGSRLVQIDDQYENHDIGMFVENTTGMSANFWTGLSNVPDPNGCSTCTKFQWEMGPLVTENQAFWKDNMPDDADGDCIYASRNDVKYMYDRPFAWSYDKCVRKRPFVCEKMAMPQGCFACFSGGFARSEDVCNGQSDCLDGSDEINCPQRYHFYHNGPSGTLTSVPYLNSQTYTWAIETPVGTIACVQFQNLQTEQTADVVTIYVGSIIETTATRLARISGNQGNPAYCGFNNMMFIKFSTDSAQTGGGFTASWSSQTIGSSEVTLTATPSSQVYTVDRFQVGGVQSFLSNRDYIFVINAETPKNNIVTVEIEAMDLHDSDRIMFYDGQTPDSSVLTTMCNTCDNTKLVFSTGSSISVILRTGNELSKSVNFSFKYRQGCYFESNADYGEIFSPGFSVGLNYPNNLYCEYVINSQYPVSFLFDVNTVLRDQTFGRTNNGDFLKIFDDGNALHTNTEGFGTSNLQGRTIHSTTGSVRVEFRTSPTRTARGFMAYWSKGCEDPMYDANTLVTTGTVDYRYTARMTLRCAQGYDFLQAQIAPGTTQVQLECGYKGEWLNYKAIPRCYPKYCGDIPNINNGYIANSTGSVYNSIAYYECYPGSTISGSSKITCEDNGRWSLEPSCNAETCPYLSNSRFISNGLGELTNGNGFEIGSIITYTCNEGYELVGEPIRHCQNDGQFSSNPPTCQPLTCFLPEVKMQVPWASRLISYGSSASLTCMTGYEVSNQLLNPVTCQANRTITEMPECIDVNECDTLAPCSHTCTNIDGSYICTCPPGYELGTNNQDCSNIDECRTPSLNNCDGRCNDNLGSYSCVCDPPYTLYTADGTSGYMIPAGETGLLPTDTFYINHTCVLQECPTPNDTVANAVLMTKRTHHRVGDYIEYQCNLGYRIRRSVLSCEDNGVWSGTIPDCINIQCPDDVVPSSQNPAVFTTGPYSYGDQLYLNCTKAGDTFSNFRFCTYNPDTDTYELQGAPYECGVVDCGTPEAVPGSLYVGLSTTTFGSTFTFTCDDTLSGSSQAGGVTVTCLKDGNWDFGSLTCVGLSCVDPGFPPGGDIVATSLADQSEVNFECLRQGYSLSHTDPLICNGNTFAGSPNVPTCYDSEKPVFTNCDTEISIQKYDQLAPRLPQFSLTDNTGIKIQTIQPPNANSTLYVTTPITVLIIATDYADNTATCTVSVKVLDEIPPTVNCPNLETIELSAEDDRQSFSVTIDSLTKSDNVAILSSTVSALPDEYTINELYNTYTYTGRVTDTSNNVATCRSQIFVTAAACSDVSFKTPLDSVKTCTDITGGRRCTVTCDAGYTLVSGNTQSFTCLYSNGVWSDTVTACVRDVTPPEIVCPSSETLFYDDSMQSIDFTSLSVTRSDNNNMNTPVFQPEAKNFTAADLYQTTQVQVTVTDDAGNSGSCTFQYTLLPSVCSPLALPVTLNAKNNVCTPTGTGYQCTIECNDSFVLRGQGQSKTISCTTGNAWPEVFPACISDVTAPSIICPASRAVYITDGDDNRIIDFNDPLELAFKDYVATDNSGVAPTVEYFPTLLSVSASFLNIGPRTVQLVATDGNGNRGTCSFQVVVLADVCSPLSLPPLDNGRIDCTQGTGSWSCNMTCNNGFGFYDRTDPFIVTSCTLGNPFSTYVPGCVSRSQTVDKVFVGKLQYEYQPSDGTLNIPNSCLSYYVQQQKLRESSMEGRLDLSCSTPFDFDITVSFFDSSYRAEISADSNGNNRRLIIYSDYTITNDDPQQSSDAVYSACSELYGDTVNNVNSAYSFKDPINGDASLCPSLVFVQAAQTSTDTTCPTPYYQSIIDNTVCTRCPTGTESNSLQCTVCGIGEYGTGSGCTSCGTGTTRFPGASSSSNCVAPCVAGSVSPSGFQPCYQCPVGSYAVDTQNCVQCPGGQTTSTTGASSVDACVPIQSVTSVEPCAQGTTPDGSGGCDLCPFGTYGVSTTSTCQSCFPTGTTTYVQGATTRNACYLECSNGLTSDTGRSPCTACPKGTRFINSTYCAPCPSGQTTVGTGALSCISELSLRVRCPRGASRNAVSGVCEKCPIGTYNSNEDGTCVSCGGTRSTYVDGATTSNMCFEKCTAGFFSASGMSPCQPCGFGNYWVSATECLACPNGGTTATTTTTSSAGCIDPCPAGQFSYNGFNMNGISCRNCPVSHYQSSVQSTTCNRCSTNQFSTLPGATSSTACQNADSLCISNRCQNGGTCRVDFNSYVCDCATGYYGENCQFAVNYCNSNPCYNGGTCSYTASGHSCQCPAGANGPNCENIVETCVVSQNNPTCLNNGHCINYVDGPKCLCREGFAGDRCATNSSICLTNQCTSPGFERCEDVSFGNNLRRKCICKTGYEGKDCEINTDDCASNPCINGGTCNDLVNGFTCTCRGGYSGTYCQNRGDRCTAQTCNSPNSICVDDYKLEEPRCICEPGYAFGTYEEYTLQLNMAPDGIETVSSETRTVVECRQACDDAGNGCQGFVYFPGNSACHILNQVTNLIASNGPNTYTKIRITPDDDFYTVKYNIDSPGSASQIGNAYTDEERYSDLTTRYGLNICGGTAPLDARCCLVGGSCDEDNLVVGMQCNAQGSVCTQGSPLNPCPDYEVQFKCAAHRVFSSNRCQVRNDYCNDNPCMNGGQCRVLQGQGHSCFCQPGYTGLNCQTDIDDCATNPCQNGGTCVDQVNGYECQCATGYEGFNCNNPINYCNRDAVTCSFRGQCRNLVDGHVCECNTGYEGSNCETEIDNCRSDPCLHGSTCTSSLNRYSCQCTPGYFGTNCERIVDNCLVTGTQCQATCRNLFNGYYCECPANTYGPNCENQPDPCGNYNKCLNGGACTVNGDSMDCGCPIRYEGDGCQILADPCGSGNVCQNNAECSLTSMGYSCACPDGYTGTNCEIDIDECNPNPCTGGAQCYNNINRFSCICPIGRTGTDCSREYDPNYDLYFNHPMGLGYAWLPYFTQVTELNALSISLWVRFSQSGGTGVYFTKFIGPQLSTATRLLDLTEKGVRIYKRDGPSDHFYLQFTRLASINDGNWHLVQVLYDMAAGNVKLYADTILSVERTAPNLVISDNTYKMWLVLGCYFDPFSQACTGSSFNGYLSQINLYNRLLTFTRTGSQQGEIPAIYTEPQKVLSDVILVWNNYEKESGVERVIPSAAMGSRCDAPGRNPPCRFYIASEVPSVTGCPSDITADSADGLTTVMWTEPVFVNLGSGSVQKNYLPGATFSWGEYHVQYIGTSPQGYKAYCTFTIFVRNNPCQSPANPFSGTQSCIDNNPTGWKGCRISCTNSNSATYKIDRDHPSIFTCGPSGQWNVAQPFKKFRYPSCGEVQQEARVDVRIRVVYDITTAACNAAKVNLQVRIAEEMIKLHNLYTNTLCRQTNCSDVEITITCNLEPGSQFTYVTLVNINLPQADARTTLDGEVLPVEDFLSYFMLAQKVLNFDTIADGNIIDESFYINPTKICPTGQVLRDDFCVECGPGNFYTYTDSTNTTAICDDCPLGTYQNEFARTECTSCPAGTITEMTGTYDFSDCKKKCSAGQYFNALLDDCSPCAIGYYQPMEGQFRCEFCGAGYTTEFTGSISRDKCTATCPSGYEISTDTCVACPIGQYRDTAESRTCVTCPTGLITQNEASTSRSDCNIPACLEGYFYSAPTNSCVICPVGQYQDQVYQTSCKSCGNPANYSTPSTGSQSQSACFFYCPSGFEVLQEGSCQICGVGTYKDNNDGLQNQCGPCPSDYRTPGTGSTSRNQCSIYKCPVGFKANVGNTGCDACPLGYYQDVEYSTDCKQCDVNYSTRNISSTSPNDCEQYCPDGYEKLDSGACNPCPRGSYKDNDNGLFSMCTACSSIYTTVGGAATSVTDCNIRTCPPGTRRTADDSNCVGCELGTYQPSAFQQTCFQCSQGESTRQVNSTSADQCEVYCSSGQELGTNGCTTCPQGYFKDNNIGLFEECTLCPTDFITQGTGSTTVNDCTVANCTAGQYRDIDNNLCLPCPIGTYQPNWWQTSCVQCGTDKTTEQVGSIDEVQCILVCQPGFEDAGGFCQQCARGYWKTEEAATTCKPCPTGSTTEGRGSTSNLNCTLPACLEGYYLDRPNSQCLQCPYDTYQNEIWMESCKTCPDGTVTLQQGSKERTNCIANCSSGREYNAGSGGCDVCPIGFYRDQSDRSQTDCQLCPIAYITENRESENAAACTVANCSAAGTYRDVNSNTCQPCPLDTYNSQKWRTACTRCPTGFGTKLERTESSTDCIKICDPGTYLGTNGACLVCPRGTFKADARSDTCSQCPNGLLTANTGQTSSDTCVISPCMAGQQYTVATQLCSDCPVGTYQPNAGQFECVDCPFLIKFTPRPGATSENECRSPCGTGEEFNTTSQSCVPCRRGYYQPQGNQFTCIQCPAGRRYTASLGSTTVNQCFSPCDNNAGNDCSTNATCSVTSGSTGYTCTCFSNYDDTGSVAGRECTHKCDRGYCRNGGTCVREPRPSCTCTEWYEGNQCQSRIRAEELSDDTMDIVIPVSIAVGGLILLLIALAVCLLCRAKKKSPKGPSQYSDYYGDRVDKASLHSYDYGQRPFYNGNGSRLMLAPYSEMQYANSAMQGDSDQYSNLDTAVYQA